MNRRALPAGRRRRVGTAVGVPSAPRARRGPWRSAVGVAYFTNAELRTHDGRTLRFYDDLLKGQDRPHQLHVHGMRRICPGMTAEPRRRAEAARRPRRATSSSYSFHPPARARHAGAAEEYAETFDVKPGWLSSPGLRRMSSCCDDSLGFADSDPVQAPTPSSKSASCASATSRSTLDHGAGAAAPEHSSKTSRQVIPSDS